MEKILPQKFFDRPTLKIAEELLGKFLVRKIGDTALSNKQHSNILKNVGMLEGMITEVEAYVGPEDKASHASRGKTKRTEVMFGKPGYWYVYMVYGMYYCLNIVTEKEGCPAAILIRSTNAVKGPGRLCRHFKIDSSTWLTINKKPADKKTGLWIEDRCIKITPRQIKRAKRIGVDYAGKWKEKKWRFYI